MIANALGFVAGAAAILALMTLGIFTASIAHADADNDFLSALNQAGITYADSTATVQRGHLVCKALTTGGFTYAETVYGMAKNSGSTVAAENAFAAIAIGFLCIDQKGKVMPAQSAFPPDARIDLSS
jgi:hypothetical protein